MRYVIPFSQVTDDIENRDSLISGMMFFVMSNRLERFDYISPYYSTTMSFAMRKPVVLAGWDNFMKPFLWSVWLWFIVCIAIVSLFLNLVSIVLGSLAKSVSLSYHTHNLRNIVYCFIVNQVM